MARITQGPAMHVCFVRSQGWCVHEESDYSSPERKEMTMAMATGSDRCRGRKECALCVLDVSGWKRRLR